MKKAVKEIKMLLRLHHTSQVRLFKSLITEYIEILYIQALSICFLSSC